MAVNPTAIAIASGVVEFLTSIVTLLRLAFRLRIRRFWWEDVWATVAMVGATAFAISDMIYFQAKTSKATNAAHWISSYAFTSVVWSVRMSLLYSIVRVASPSTSLRKFMRAIGALFIIVWGLLIASKSSWYKNNPRAPPGHWSCPIPRWIAIFAVAGWYINALSPSNAHFLAADVVGDATLVILSLRLLWRVKLPRRQRRMILLVFSSNAVMSMSSLLHAIAQIIYDENLALISGNLEFIASLVVCNLLVVVTYIYRVYMSSSESESSSDDDDFTTPVSRDIASLTTVDLNTLDSASMSPPSEQTV